MAKFGLVLCDGLLTVLAFPLIRLIREPSITESNQRVRNVPETYSLSFLAATGAYSLRFCVSLP